MAPNLPESPVSGVEAAKKAFRQRQLSFPANESSKALDFRRIFKKAQMDDGQRSGSSSLIKKCVSTIRRRNANWNPDQGEGLQSHVNLPNEILAKIFTNLEGTDLRNARVVNRRWHRVIDNTKYVTNTLGSRTVSRFVVRAAGKGAVELRWCVYGTAKSRSLMLSAQQLRHVALTSLEFSFRQFEIQRIILKNVALSNDLLLFFTRHFFVSPNFAPISLVFEGIDVSQVSHSIFEKFFALTAPNLETLQLRSLTGLRAESVNDHFMSYLDASKVRSIEISSPKFAFTTRPKVLRVSDVTLARLSTKGNFPALHLERCQITSLMLAHYTENYLKKAALKTLAIQRQCCKIRQCPAVNGEVYERECRRRSLSCEEREDCQYSVHTDDGNTEAVSVLGCFHLVSFNLFRHSPSV
ncbi:hypothetical protein L596_024500 [Steinernema carpocapsae]|uniref:F-box domain-containing protein n=1 Tax=Steinernema carpocapsae TaxID=34508 RepID=A0A4U5MGW2_STECR|nr:hypothetical protein L596_024500 [Steinernema carpocapsae]